MMMMMMIIILIVIIIRVISQINTNINWNYLKIIQKYLNNIRGKHDIKELQETTILGTAHILG